MRSMPGIYPPLWIGLLTWLSGLTPGCSGEVSTDPFSWLRILWTILHTTSMRRLTKSQMRSPCKWAGPVSLPERGRDAEAVDYVYTAGRQVIWFLGMGTETRYLIGLGAKLWKTGVSISSDVNGSVIGTGEIKKTHIHLLFLYTHTLSCKFYPARVTSCFYMQ